jgi:NAD(P)-dependent dehydrogenase (short-subunit alcohol dehydrogenase family)
MGFGLVQQFLAAGQTVVAVGRNAASSTNLQTLAGGTGGRLMLFNCDIGDSKSVEDFGLVIREKVKSVEVLVNNAGLYLPTPFFSHLNSPTLGISQDTLEENVSNISSTNLQTHFTTNVVGTLLITQVIAPLFHPGSKLLNISSMCASLDLAPRRPIQNVVGYSISKASLNMLTVKQAMFYKECIVVAIDPGNVKTDMNPDAENTVQEVVGSLVKVVDGLKTEHSGQFLSWEGERMVW